MHDLHINDLGVHSDLVRPGQSVSVTFTPTQLGRFHIHCAVPGHEAAGMYGTLHVIEE